MKVLNAVEVITLFVEDIEAARAFYECVFGLNVVYEDAVSAVVKLENLMINLLLRAEAPTLIEPRALGPHGAGPRLLLTVRVDDANGTCAELERHGVKLLNGPIDRPWGRRTAAFADPDGNVWEIAEVLAPGC